MKIYTLLVVAVFLVFFFTACGRNDNAQSELITAQYELPASSLHVDIIHDAPPYSEDITQDESALYLIPPADTAQYESANVTAEDVNENELQYNNSLSGYKYAVSGSGQRIQIPYYFLTPLEEWLEGGVPPPAHQELMHGSAYFVYLDGLGTQGLLAIRYEGQPEWPLRFAKVFYLYNDAVVYKDIGMIEGFPFSIARTIENRLIMVGGDGGTAFHILFEMENGKLIYDFAISRHMRGSHYYNGYWHNYYYYYRIPGGIYRHHLKNWESRISIVSSEYHEIMTRHSLYYLTWPIEEATDDTEEERIRIRFPYVADIARYIALDNGTLVDKRLFPVLESEFSRSESDIWLMFELIIRHFKYMDKGDEDMLFSTMLTMDGSDMNYFHPAIFNLMDRHRGTSLFVERITLSSAGFFIRVVISNAQGEEFHVWPLVQPIITVYAPGYESETWLISRYFNHVCTDGVFYWENHLLEYLKTFR